MRTPSARSILVALAGLFIVAQLVPIRRDNPPAGGAGPAMPPAVAAILHRSCSNCHTNETVWPWYSRVAPVSWLVASDVHEGRRHLNFSEWTETPAERRQRRMNDLVEEVEHGDMPPWYYTPLHPDARLSADDVRALTSWAKSQ